VVCRNGGSARPSLPACIASVSLAAESYRGLHDAGVRSPRDVSRPDRIAAFARRARIADLDAAERVATTVASEPGREVLASWRPELAS
jgi:hypothetical protein